MKIPFVRTRSDARNGGQVQQGNGELITPNEDELIAELRNKTPLETIPSIAQVLRSLLSLANREVVSMMLLGPRREFLYFSDFPRIGSNPVKQVFVLMRELAKLKIAPHFAVLAFGHVWNPADGRAVKANNKGLEPVLSAEEQDIVERFNSILHGVDIEYVDSFSVRGLAVLSQTQFEELVQQREGASVSGNRRIVATGIEQDEEVALYEEEELQGGAADAGGRTGPRAVNDFADLGTLMGRESAARAAG